MRHEPKETRRSVSSEIVRMQGGGQVGVGLGPGDLAVELHLVCVLRARLEIVDADERVVVAFDAEGRLGEAEHLDLAGLVGFDPDGRLGFVRVAEHGSHDHFGHDVRVYPNRARDDSRCLTTAARG